jgi:hypothetical protein
MKIMTFKTREQSIPDSLLKDQLFVRKEFVGKLPECPRIIVLRMFVFLGVAPGAWFLKTLVHAYLYIN